MVLKQHIKQSNEQWRLLFQALTNIFFNEVVVREDFSVTKFEISEIFLEDLTRNVEPSMSHAHNLICQIWVKLLKPFCSLFWGASRIVMIKRTFYNLKSYWHCQKLVNTVGYLINEHLNNGNIWITDFFKSVIQIIHYSDAWFLLLTGQENCGQINCYFE